MKKLSLFLFLLVGCSSAPTKSPYMYDKDGHMIPRSTRTIACIERFLKLDVSASEASQVCKDLYKKSK